MYNKIPILLNRTYPDRVGRWLKRIAFEDVPRTRYGSVCAARLELPARHAAAAGVRIAFFADAHCREGKRTREVIADAARAIGEFAPDYMICGGDWVGDVPDLTFGREMLRQFPDAPVKLAVPGNWERAKIWLEPDFWRDYFAAGGFRMLFNEFYEDSRCAFFGLDDPKGGFPRGGMAWPTQREKILLAHNPDAAVMVDFAGLLGEVDLVLAGHTHGGQIRLPWIGAPVTSSLYHKFDAGLFRRCKSGTNMYITSGLGSLSFPFRFRCPLEVVLLTLTSPVNSSPVEKP